MHKTMVNMYLMDFQNQKIFAQCPFLMQKVIKIYENLQFFPLKNK